MNKLQEILNPTVRAWIYRVLIAAGAIAVFYGLLTSEEVVLWGGLLAIVLNVLPTANTSIHADKQLDQGLRQVDQATATIVDKTGETPIYGDHGEG